jgi:predicted TPR repeat methyltransferase
MACAPKPEIREFHVRTAVENLKERAGSNPEDVRHLYDDWADDYDQSLLAWGYEAPSVAAAYVHDLAPADTFVLDAGCGTGLSGEALHRAGFSNIVGVDFSAESLELAEKRGVYTKTLTVDLTQQPLPFGAGAFGAIVCVGVMSYLPDVEAVCREFCRLTRPGGIIVLTQRSDLFDERKTQQAFDALAQQGLWEQIEVTDARPYLPGNPDFDGIGVHYGIFRRR